MGGLWQMKMFLFLMVFFPEGGGGGNSGTNSTEATGAVGYHNLTVELVPVTFYQGYVRLIIDGEPGTICVDGFNDVDALVICRMLGYATAEASSFGPVDGRVWLSELACAGNETSVMDCRARWNPQSCWSDEVATVACYRPMPPADEVEVELVGGDSKSGRVELIMYGERGTVCDDRWDSKDATVICRMFGYAAGLAFGFATYGEGENKIWLDEVACKGNETSISDCRLNFDDADCTHIEDAGVYCYNDTATVDLVGAVFPNIGRVEIIIDGVRGSVCDIGFSQHDANVVCRELGYKTAITTDAGSFQGGGDYFWLNELKCTGEERSILDCESSFGNRRCSFNVGVICTGIPNIKVSLLGDIKDEGQAFVKLETKQFDLCPDGWDEADASVLCRSLGYTGGMVHGGKSVQTHRKLLADLGCSGNENHVTECDQSGWIANCSTSTPSFAICTYTENIENLNLGLNIVFIRSHSMDVTPHTKTLQDYLLSNIIDGISRIMDGYIENPYSTGLISYSSSANSDLFLGLCLNNACTSDDLSNILTVSNEIGNAVGEALDLATTHFSDHQGHRILAPNLCILFVTSPLDNVTQTMEAAQRLKDQGVVLMVVAVGNGVKSEQLEGLASDTKVYFSAEIKEKSSEGNLVLVANETAESVLAVQKYALILPRYSKCYHGYIDFTIIIDLQDNKGTVVNQIIEFLGKLRNSTEVVVSIWIKDDPTSQHLLPLQDFVNTNRRFSLDTGKSLQEIMEMARVIFVNKDRKLAENIIIIVTGEIPTADIQDVERESLLCQKANIHIMALGVGKKITTEELLSLVSDERGLTTVLSTKRLKNGLDTLVKDICPAACDVGWIYYDGSCYRSEKTRSSWLEAQKHCSNMDASLISITSPEIELWLHSTFLQERPEVKYVLIGLRKQVVKGSQLSYGYRWANGKPHQYSRCCLHEEKGDCVYISAETTMWNSMGCKKNLLSAFYEVLLVCEKQAANNIISKKVADVAPLYHENTCTFSNTSTDVLYTSGNHCRSVLDVFRSRTFVNYTFTCSNKELISSLLVCDGLDHCTDGSDETNCSEACESHNFPCDNGRCISLGYVCDFSNDCGDNSDEEKCVYVACEDSEFECDSGQCIPSTSVCDLYNDCYDRTDELDCAGTCDQYQCEDEKCIPIDWLRDEIDDCGEHEVNLTYPPLTYTGRYAQLNRLYLNIPSKIQPKVDLPCTMVIDQFGKTFKQEKCNEPVICPIGFHRCPSSYCIPIDRICDGVMDCTDGEDEADCDDYLCPGYFRCPGLSYCIHPALVCNGEINCPGGKDEVLCHFTCPSYCSCEHGHVVCKDIDFDVEDLDPRTRSLDVSDSYIFNSAFDKFIFLVRAKVRNVGLTGVDILQNNFNLRELDLSQNNISQIPFRSFVNHGELRVLDLSLNSFQAIDRDSYIGLDSLEVLILKSNQILTIGAKSFTSLKNLKVLDVSDNSIQEISDNAFHGLFNLWTLFMQNNKIKNYGRNVYEGADNVLTIETSVFALCCPTIRPKSVVNCKSPESSISSCNDLLGNEILRLCIWILCVTSIFGNIISTVMRLWLERASMKNGFGVFVTNLGISDFLMGMYLLIIAVADNHFRGNYVWNDKGWRESIFCKVAGFLSTLSSEASTFFICLITLDRFIVIWFPFSNVRFRLRSGIVASVIAWLVAAAIAYMPLTPWFMYWDFYGKNGACLALPFSTERTPGWLYSTIIFTGLNFGSFLFIAIGQYLIYRAIKQDPMVASSAGRKNELAVARGLLLIVCSDFLCWFPVGVVSLMALSGIQIGGEVYAFTAVFVLPVNSALNPFLYTIPALIKKRKMAKQRSRKSMYSTNVPSVTGMTSLQNDHVTLEDALGQVDGSLKAQLLGEIMSHLSTFCEPDESQPSSNGVTEREDVQLYVKQKWLLKQKLKMRQSLDTTTRT